MMLNMFLLNLVMSVLYIVLTGDYSGLNFTIGFVISFGVLELYCLGIGGSNYPLRLLKIIRFGFWFMWILFLANIQIAIEIVTPGLSQTPRIIRYPVDHLSVTEITILSNAITLTPGTLVVDVAEDCRHIYVHCMYAKDRDAAVSELDQLRLHLESEVFA